MYTSMHTRIYIYMYIYGLYMDYIWTIYGLYMDYIYIPYIYNNKYYCITVGFKFSNLLVLYICIYICWHPNWLWMVTIYCMWSLTHCGDTFPELFSFSQTLRTNRWKAGRMENKGVFFQIPKKNWKKTSFYYLNYNR